MPQLQLWSFPLYIGYVSMCLMPVSTYSITVLFTDGRSELLDKVQTSVLADTDMAVEALDASCIVKPSPDVTEAKGQSQEGAKGQCGSCVALSCFVQYQDCKYRLKKLFCIFQKGTMLCRWISDPFYYFKHDIPWGSIWNRLNFN